MSADREAELEGVVGELVSWLTGPWVFVSESRVEELDAVLAPLLGSGGGVDAVAGDAVSGVGAGGGEA